MKVYCGGKIAKNDWRHTLFPGLREKQETLRRDDPEYAGPFFIGCDHGCYHGPDTHGMGLNEQHGRMQDCADPAPGRQQVADFCLEWLRTADILFVWLDSLTAFGTVAEMGYAHGLRKPIWLYLPVDAPTVEGEMWFPLLLASERRHAEGPIQAFENFEKHAPAQIEFERIRARARQEAERQRLTGDRFQPLALSSGFIYILQMGQVYKIGKTRNLDQRVRNLAIQLPERADLIHSIRSDDIDTTERYLHRVFQRRRLNGEWFRLELLEIQWLRGLQRLDWRSTNGGRG